MSDNRRKVCVVTGTRAEYGLLKPVMEGIRDSDRLELQIIATGTHLEEEFGSTKREIKKDGFKIDAEVPVIAKGDERLAMTISIGNGIKEMALVLEKLKPEIVVVLGDRYETLASAIAASYTGRLLVHLFGGDNPQAGYDEYTRHAITKMAHIHFPTTEKSGKRIIRMGENPKLVFCVGSTALDTIVNKKLPSKELLCNKYDIKPAYPLLLAVQHPLSTMPKEAKKGMRATMEAIDELGYQTILIYPNADPGGRAMIEVMKEFERRPNIKVYKSLPFEEYLGIMGMADVMIGNSSSGIMESASFHLPVVNIGTRQQGRERSENVLDVPHDKGSIKNAVQKALSDKGFRETVRNCKSPYGDGKASERIVKVLEEIIINKKLLKKEFHDG